GLRRQPRSAVAAPPIHLLADGRRDALGGVPPAPSAREPARVVGPAFLPPSPGTHDRKHARLAPPGSWRAPAHHQPAPPAPRAPRPRLVATGQDHCPRPVDAPRACLRLLRAAALPGAGALNLAPTLR